MTGLKQVRGSCMTLAISDLSQKQFEAEEYEWEENKLRQ